MQRAINISTDVFAAIWARRQEGEETENEILRRILGCAGDITADATAQPETGGVYDSRNSVMFPEGFVIFRRHKGRKFEAVASGGDWVVIGTNDRYPTLNQMNSALTGNSENVWNGNWKYKRLDGVDTSIAELRSKP